MNTGRRDHKPWDDIDRGITIMSRRSFGLRHLIDMNARWMLVAIRRGDETKAVKRARIVANLAIDYLKETGRWPLHYE